MKNKGKYTLKYFILNSNTLKLYRESYKLVGSIKDTTTKNEMRDFIRNEFRNDTNKEYNEANVEYKLGVARKKINELKEQLNFSK